MNSNHCIISNQDQLMNFTDHIIDDRTIVVLPFTASPYSTQLKANNNQTLFEVCGPLLMLVIELAKSQKSLIQFKGLGKSVSEMIAIILDERVDLLIAPAVTTQYFKYQEQLKFFGKNLMQSNFIGYFEADVIAARKYPGTAPLFANLLCYSFEVWALIITSIIILSLISSFAQNFQINLKEVLKYFFNYLVLLLLKPFEKLVFHSTSKQILIVWLLSAFVLSNQFTVYLMDFMIRAVPIIKIDTMEELSEHRDMKIIVRYDDSFTFYLNLLDSPLKQSLYEQLETYETFQDISFDLTKGLRNGTLANVNKRNMLIFNLVMLSEQEEVDENEPRLIDMLYFSEKTDFYEPYFIIYNEESPEWLKTNLNSLVTLMRENGLSEQWLQDILNYNRKRIGTTDRKLKNSIHKFSKISLENAFDLIYLLLFGFLISFSVCLIEHGHKQYNIFY